MFRLSPRRSHRSQGFKVKHALQLFLLICVSIWLLYQIRHSREKKAEFEEAARVAKESIKLGRKDLLPRSRMDDPIIRDVSHKEDEEEHKIIDHPKPQGVGNNAEIRTGVGGSGRENHRVGQRETDRRWDPLYAKQHLEDRKEEETEENKDEEGVEESKEHENVETENEENKETEETQENANEGKESGEENEGEESNETENEDKGADENDGKNDGIDARDAAHESLNTTAISELENEENKAHEFVRWSNTNSTEAYIHQEERARNMRETETDDNMVVSDRVQGNNSTASDGERNVSEVDSSHPFSTIGKDINELQRRSNDSSSQNWTVTAPDLTQNGKQVENSQDNSTSASGQVLNSRAAYSAPNPTYSRATLFRRQSAKSEGTRASVLSSNTSADGAQKLKEEVDYSSVSGKKDENSASDDVQKLKEIVDYSSVSRKKDESSDENTRFYNTDTSQDTEALSTASNGTKDASSVPQEEKDARTDLETLPGSLTGGGNRGEAAAE